MTPESINKAMAELDGLEHLRYVVCGSQALLFGFKRQPDSPAEWSAGCVGDQVVSPNYFEDLNAVAQVVEKLPLSVLAAYRYILPFMCMFTTLHALDAPAHMRCKAILFATKKWED